MLHHVNSPEVVSSKSSSGKVWLCMKGEEYGCSHIRNLEYRTTPGTVGRVLGPNRVRGYRRLERPVTGSAG